MEDKMDVSAYVKELNRRLKMRGKFTMFPEDIVSFWRVNVSLDDAERVIHPAQGSAHAGYTNNWKAFFSRVTFLVRQLGKPYPLVHDVQHLYHEGMTCEDAALVLVTTKAPAAIPALDAITPQQVKDAFLEGFTKGIDEGAYLATNTPKVRPAKTPGSPSKVWADSEAKRSLDNRPAPLNPQDFFSWFIGETK